MFFDILIVFEDVQKLMIVGLVHHGTLNDIVD